MDDRVADLQKRMDALEVSDRLQTDHLKSVRRLQLACVAAIGLSIVLSNSGISSETKDRIISGVIVSSLTGLLGSEFLEPKKN